jgi:hypothetical protein
MESAPNFTESKPDISCLLCNSTVIEMCGDKIRVSHGFEGCQPLKFIVEICTGRQRNAIDDIIGLDGLCYSIFV